MTYVHEIVETEAYGKQSDRFKYFSTLSKLQYKWDDDDDNDNNVSFYCYDKEWYSIGKHRHKFV